MASITLRSVKAAPLTIAEVDANFENLNTDKIEQTDAVSTNTADKVVRRDESGNFAANEITAQNFDSLSDATLKTNITGIDNALDIVAQLQGVEFRWGSDGSKSAGVIAQELEEILPHLVHTSADGIKSVSYNGIIAYLIEAVNELSDKVRELENKN